MEPNYRTSLDSTLQLDEGRDPCPGCGLDLKGHSIYEADDLDLICGRCGAVARREAASAVPPASKQGIKHIMPQMRPTYITDNDYLGQRVRNKRFEVSRMRLTQARVFRDTTDKSMRIAYHIAARVSDLMHIPAVHLTSILDLYSKAHKAGLVHSRSIEAFVCASIYITCRQVGIHAHSVFDFEQVVEPLSGGSNSKFSVDEAYRMMLDRLPGLSVPVVDISAMVAKPACKLGLPQPTVVIALDLIGKAQAARLTSGRTPTGIVAAVLFMAAQKSGRPVAMKDAASACGTVVNTVRKRIAELTELGAF